VCCVLNCLHDLVCWLAYRGTLTALKTCSIDALVRDQCAVSTDFKSPGSK
jgi:hypothetical protein